MVWFLLQFVDPKSPRDSSSQNGLYDEIIPLATEFVDPNSPRDSSSQNGLYDEIIPLAMEFVDPILSLFLSFSQSSTCVTYR
ncbi:unnamed protein product [Gordionus sp. m RMFG-2023]